MNLYEISDYATGNKYYALASGEAGAVYLASMKHNADLSDLHVGQVLVRGYQTKERPQVVSSKRASQIVREVMARQ